MAPTSQPQPSRPRSFTLEQGKTNLLYLGVVLIVAVLIAVAILEGLRKGEGNNTFILKRKKNENGGSSVSTNTSAYTAKPLEEVVLTKSENPQDVPSGFPGIPLYNKREITDSYELAYKTSNSDQKVISFSSSKPVKDTFAFYKDWAPKNGWIIVHQLNDENESRLIIQKNKEIVNITIIKDGKNAKSSIINMTW